MFLIEEVEIIYTALWQIVSRGTTEESRGADYVRQLVYNLTLILV